MYGTVTQIHVTPDQLSVLVREALRLELANYTPPKPEGSDLPELMTRRQTAEALQVSLSTLHDWAKDTPDRSAILVPRHIHGRVRYHRDEVLAALKESRRFKSPKTAGQAQTV